MGVILATYDTWDDPPSGSLAWLDDNLLDFEAVWR